MKTPITYYGGKQSLLKHILPLVPTHTRYTEAFLGGAALFFAKEPTRSEVINDLDGNLIQFYRVAQTNYPALKEKIEATLHARDIHAEAGHVSQCHTFTRRWISLGRFGCDASKASQADWTALSGTTSMVECPNG